MAAPEVHQPNESPLWGLSVPKIDVLERVVLEQYREVEKAVLGELALINYWSGNSLGQSYHIVPTPVGVRRIYTQLIGEEYQRIIVNEAEKEIVEKVFITDFVVARNSLRVTSKHSRVIIDLFRRSIAQIGTGEDPIGPLLRQEGGVLRSYEGEGYKIESPDLSSPVSPSDAAAYIMKGRLLQTILWGVSRKTQVDGLVLPQPTAKQILHQKGKGWNYY